MKNLHDIPREQSKLPPYWDKLRLDFGWSTEQTVDAFRRFQRSLERLRQAVEESTRHT
jgi:hypothetical protein